jgi:hypothetical protein
VNESPYDPKNPARWLYDIHNRVNHKLRSQCAKDPKVINPGPDPSFEEIESRYKYKKLNKKVGQEFLLSIAVNFTPTPRRLEIQKRFIKNLSDAYPLFKEFVDKHTPDFLNYAEWMNTFTNISISEVESFKSKCKKGKTCRKQKGSGRRLTLRHKRS